METKNFFGELSKSNEIAKVKANVQCYANNVGAILSMLNNFQAMRPDEPYYSQCLEELDEFISRWCLCVDDLVNGLRATDTNKE